jgi:hypothetical protein
VPAQIPYVISGGIAGLGLVALGSSLIVAHSLRTDRVELRGSIDDLRAAVERIGEVGATSGDDAAGGFAPKPRVVPADAAPQAEPS